VPPTARQEAVPPVFAPAPLGPLTLRNRIIKAATFEGVTPGGTVSNELIDFHRLVAAGGAALSTVAYLAVSPEGRTDRHCLRLSADTVPGLRRLTDAVHAEGAAAAAQIGHAGPVANARSNGAPALSPSGGFTPMGSRLRAVDVAGIERITEDYRRAAELAVEAGFDSIEVHVGHNYLLSAFLSPKLNRRDDQFGGSVENRARFARTVLRTVRDAAGPGVAVTAKLNMADGVDGGLWLDESVEIARLFEADGALDALELTGGSSLANPMYLFRGDAPRREFGATLPTAVRLGFRVIGHRFLRAYPYEEAFFLPYARQFRRALSTPLILLGGITELATIEGALAEGFAFVAMARALLREPDLPNRMRAGSSATSLCIHCNKCMPTIYSGTRCVLVTGPPGGWPPGTA
jgi:2,4-dienoyl-CoA reductase-like NADH-dependent reductase (Old Yellow Enzyme family)